MSTPGNNITDEEVRHKLINRGLSELSDAELLSIIIREGGRNGSAIELSNKILVDCNNSLNELSKLSLSKLRMAGGMGVGRAAVIAASVEFGRRTRFEQATMIDVMRSNDDVISYFRPLISGLSHEEFWVVYLGVGHRILDKIKIGQGGINCTIVDNRLVIKRAIDKLAISMVVVHNHPSGNTDPSENDVLLTKRLFESAKLFDIELLDHIIVSQESAFSFKGEGLI